MTGMRAQSIPRTDIDPEPQDRSPAPPAHNLPSRGACQILVLALTAGMLAMPLIAQTPPPLPGASPASSSRTRTPIGTRNQPSGAGFPGLPGRPGGAPMAPGGVISSNDLQLTGLLALPWAKRAYVTRGAAGKSAENLQLILGQPQDGLELLSIDAANGTVRIRNNGVDQTLALNCAAIVPSAQAATKAPPRLRAIPGTNAGRALPAKPAPARPKRPSPPAPTTAE